jgi:hypothetical protein
VALSKTDLSLIGTNNPLGIKVIFVHFIVSKFFAHYDLALDILEVEVKYKMSTFSFLYLFFIVY